MGKVRYFCRCGLEANILRPSVWKLFNHIVCNTLLICPSWRHVSFCEFIWNNDRYSPGKYHDLFQLSMKSQILVHVLIGKFSWGLELSELNLLNLFCQNNLICLFKVKFLADSNIISEVPRCMCHSGKSDCLVFYPRTMCLRKTGSKCCDIRQKSGQHLLSYRVRPEYKHYLDNRALLKSLKQLVRPYWCICLWSCVHLS